MQVCKYHVPKSLNEVFFSLIAIVPVAGNFIFRLTVILAIIIKYRVLFFCHCHLIVKTLRMQQAYNALLSKRNRRHFHLYYCTFDANTLMVINVYILCKSGQKPLLISLIAKKSIEGLLPGYKWSKVRLKTTQMQALKKMGVWAIFYCNRQ